MHVVGSQLIIIRIRFADHRPETSLGRPTYESSSHHSN
jgi:hypothetical protein